MPIPASRAPAATYDTGWDYIHSTAYAQQIYNDNDFFTMRGQISPYIKEYVLDEVNKHFYDLAPNVDDPALTDLMRNRMARCEHTFYQMLTLDMHLDTIEELYGGVFKDITEDVKTDGKHTGSSKALTEGVSSNESATEGRVNTGEQDVTTQSDVSSKSTSQGGTAATVNSTSGATRVVTTNAGTQDGGTLATTTGAQDSASAGINANRTAGKSESEDSTSGHAGSVNSDFPMVLGQGTGSYSSTVDGFLGTGGNGDNSAFATSGGKSSSSSSGEQSAKTGQDGLGADGSVSSAESSSNAFTQNLGGTYGTSTVVSDPVDSSGKTVTNSVSYGEGATSSDGSTHSSSREDTRQSNTQQASQSKSASTGSSASEDDVLSHREYHENGSGLTRAEIMRKLYETFVTRMSALDFLVTQLEPLFTLKFGEYPPYSVCTDSDGFPL